MSTDSPPTGSSENEAAPLVGPAEKEVEVRDVEKQESAGNEHKGRQFLVWTVINTLATIAIVKHFPVVAELSLTA